MRCQFFLLLFPLISPAWSVSQWAADEVDWIFSLQQPSGAILLTTPNPDASTWVSPISTNIALRNILRIKPDAKTTDAVRSHLNWYLSHVNLPDKDGVNGTIYEYYVDVDDQLQTYEDQLGIDQYGATFMSLINAYLHASADRRFAREHLPLIKTIAESVWTTFKPEFELTRPDANDRYSFMFNNLEVYKGHRDFAEFLDTMNDPETSDYRLKADLIRHGIEERFWNPARSEYQWYDADPPSEMDWEEFDPGVMVNLYAITNQLPEALTNSRRQIIYDKFKETQLRKWMGLELDDFPQAFICDIIQMLERPLNEQNARNYLREYVRNVRKKYLPDRQWTWYTMEAGYFSLCLQYMRL